MPAADARKDTDGTHEPPREVERERDRERDKGGRAKGSAKTKDLSHVPCKFFKVGSCTAGSSCPFSHAVLEPGQAKEVCTWFVKGNCKFGHKCALAHILPGQSMSMDRKNKKAAQLAAQAGGAGGGGRDGGRRGHKSGAHGSGSGSAQSRNALLTGSTAPTRALSGNARSGIPMPLKATLSPSTPAPPVKDTDFASFGLPDESNKLPSAPAQGKPPAAPAPDTSSTVPLSNPTDTGPVQIESSAGPEVKEPGPLPTSTPTAPRRVGNPHGSPPVDFGPIGSPPRSLESGGRPARVNGFSPGTSPNHAGLSSSPFSAPGSRTVFAIQDEDSSGGLAGRSGLSASLGAMMPWSNDHPSRRLESGVVGEVVVEDEDLEEFLPGSLTDLLTPEERSRRMSRTNGARPNMLGAEREGALGAQRPSLDGQHHRYSRSVPAPSLLQDIKSIWSDNNGAITGGSDLAGTPGTSVTGGGLGNGTPSSFTSNSGLAGRSGEEMLSPSNASAAFLPGLHHHYLNSKVQRTNLLGGGLSAQHTSNANGLTHSGLVGSHSAGVGAAALSPPRTSALGNQFPVGSPSSDVFYGQQRNAAPSNDGAWQAHAPGQSLPQGLAAGYSRIHALPPPVIASPSTPGAFSQAGGYSPGTKAFGHAQSPPGDWHSTSPGAANAFDSLVQFSAQTQGTMGNSLGGLESVFSRLSYSAATTRSGGGILGAVANGARNTSGRSFNPQGSLSPLRGPVLTGDDDDLFSMDG